MKHFIAILFLLTGSLIWSQPKLEMTPTGFAPIELQTPNLTTEKLIEKSRAWAAYYNKNGFDVFNVTENSLAISALNENAYFYRNIGVPYYYNIRYNMTIVFKDNNTYTLSFEVKEIYAKEVLVKTTIADFFTPDGKLKEDFKEVKPSLEKTVNRIVKSYTRYLAR